MTIKECIRKNGWLADNTDDSWAGCLSMDVDIDFYNNGNRDETQFRINAYDVNELDLLFTQFCRENNILHNTVISIIIVKFYEDAV